MHAHVLLLTPQLLSQDMRDEDETAKALIFRRVATQRGLFRCSCSQHG